MRHSRLFLAVYLIFLLINFIMNLPFGNYLMTMYFSNKMAVNI